MPRQFYDDRSGTLPIQVSQTLLWPSRHQTHTTKDQTPHRREVLQTPTAQERSLTKTLHGRGALQWLQTHITRGKSLTNTHNTREKSYKHTSHRREALQHRRKAVQTHHIGEKHYKHTLYRREALQTHITQERSLTNTHHTGGKSYKHTSHMREALQERSLTNTPYRK